MAEILRRSEGALSLVDASGSLPGLLRRPGLRHWTVFDAALKVRYMCAYTLSHAGVFLSRTFFVNIISPISLCRRRTAPTRTPSA